MLFDAGATHGEWVSLMKRLALSTMLLFPQDWPLYCASLNHKGVSVKVTWITSVFLTDFHSGLSGPQTWPQWTSSRSTTPAQNNAFPLWHLPSFSYI